MKKPELIIPVDEVDEKNMSLWKINDAIRDILLDTEFDDEDAEGDMGIRLDALMMQRDKKLEQIGYVRLEQKQKIAELEVGIKKLSKWRDSLKKRGAWLDVYTTAEMVTAGIKRFEGKWFKMSRRKKPIRSVVQTTEYGEVDIEHLDQRFVEKTEDYKVLKAEAIRHYKNTGEKPEGFDFVEGEETLVIK